MTPRPIEILMEEHRLIEKVLAALETCVARADSGQEIARSDIAGFAEFFREFADRCHHGKEEDRLFVELCEHGFSREFGPVRVMLDEHDVGRACVRALAKIGQGDGTLSGDERERAGIEARQFIGMLRQHIQKEDMILFPAAANSLPADLMQRLQDEFEQFDRETLGEGSVARLHELAESLIRNYPAA